MISLIWAMDVNWLIGKDNKLPWRYPEDLKYFKEMTHNKVVLMGDKTYHSMKYYYQGRSLPFKTIYVASLSTEKSYDDAIIVNNLDKFLTNFKEELWVIGGSLIYELTLPYADKLYITWVKKAYEGDKHFKRFDLDKEFRLIRSKQGETKELEFSIYERV